MEAIKRLAERLQESCEPLGLTMRNFAVLPNMEGGPDHAQVVFTIRTEDLLKDEEQVEFDKQFEQMMKDQKLNERDQAFSEMPERLRNLLDRTRGILPDDEEGSSA